MASSHPIRSVALLVFASSMASFAFGGSLSFPTPVTSEVPASPIAYGWAAGSQTDPHAASNGDITLVAWDDGRAGAYSITQPMAARVDRDGKVLDPLGIDLSAAVPYDRVHDVVWNGDAFAVVTGSSAPQLVFVSVDGAVIGRKTLAITGSEYAEYVAASGRGAAVRLLYAQRIASNVRFTLFDGAGRIVNMATWVPPAGRMFDTVGGGPAPDGFAVIARERWDAIEGSAIAQTRLSFDGHILSTSETNLPFTYLDGTEAIAGGSDGVLIVVQTQWTTPPSVVAHRLDQNGAYAGSIEVAPAGPNAQSGSHPRLEWDGQQYLIASLTFEATGQSYTRLATIAPGATTATLRQVAHFAGALASSVSLVHGVVQPFVFTSAWYPSWSSSYDVYVQRFTPSLDATEPKVMTFSATRQLAAHVAATENGYAVAWSEIGPDQYVHAFVRRFALSGAPIDGQPLPIAQVSVSPTYPDAASVPLLITATDTAYLISWMDGSQNYLRRLGERGDWIDPQPVIAPNPIAALGSDGSDALALVSVSNSISLAPQKVPMSGPLVLPPALTIGSSIAIGMHPSIAFGAGEYLVAWAEDLPPCYILCPAPPPVRVLAVRLRADGTAIDSQPLELERGTYPSNATVAWNAGRFVVAWSNGTQIHGATVTPVGAVGDVDPTNGAAVLATTADCCAPFTPKLLPFEDGFALLTKSGRSSPDSSVIPAQWEGVVFCGDCPLKDVAALPRTALLQVPDTQLGVGGSLDAASSGRAIVLAYDHPADADAGWVPRVFSRVFAPATRRRALTP